MKGDAQSYGRATLVSVIGLVMQAMAAAGLGIYAGLSDGDHAATSAALHIGVGVFVWLPLVFLFDLHRRERREAVELDRLALDEGSGVFETTEQPRAGRTLDAARKYLLPGLSLLIGGTLLLIGIARFNQAGSAFGTGSMDGVALNYQGFGIAIGLALAIAGFVFARFVSGMATQRIWAPLRAGASYAVGTALLGLTITVARFVDSSFGRPVAMDAVAHAVPIFTMVLGGEMLLNFVLDIYRPRKPGEDPRPGFDSRLLGLLAAPDKIAENVGEALNYQFGVEVSKSWFYQLLQRWWPGLIAIALLVAWGTTSLVVIEPHQRAMVLTFGSPSAPILSFGDRDGDEIGPGLHIVAPWPMTEVYVPVSSIDKGHAGGVKTSTGVRLLHLGTNPPKPGEAILWTNEHTVREVYSLVQPARIGMFGSEESVGDVSLSLVAVEIPVQYVIDDVRAFDTLAQPGHRDEILDVMGERALMRLMAHKNIGEILGPGRTILGTEIGRDLAETFSSIPTGSSGVGSDDAGIELLGVGVAGAHPPQKAAVYFERVVQEGQLREAKIEAAREFEARTLNSVASPIELPDGSTVTASDIVAMIEDLTARAEEGERGRGIVERELDIQRLLEQAGGQAGSSLISASAQRWETHMGERAKAALFQGQLASFHAAPALYMTSKYFDSLLAMMADSRVFLTGDRIETLNITIDGHSRDSNLDLFNPEVGSDYQP